MGVIIHHFCPVCRRMVNEAGFTDYGRVIVCRCGDGHQWLILKGA